MKYLKQKQASKRAHLVKKQSKQNSSLFNNKQTHPDVLVMECYDEDQETTGGQAYGTVDNHWDFWTLKTKQNKTKIQLKKQ